MAEWDGMITGKRLAMAQRRANMRSVVAVAATVISAIALLVSIGMCPSLNYFAKKQEVTQEFDAIKTTNEMEHRHMWQATGEIKEEIKRQRIESQDQRESIEQKLDKIDGRLWQVLQEVKQK